MLSKSYANSTCCTLVPSSPEHICYQEHYLHAQQLSNSALQQMHSCC